MTTNNTHNHTHTHNCNHSHNHGGRMTTSNSAPHLSVVQLKGMPVSQFFGVRRGMTLTTCCVCNAPLEDAQSVTEGVGPICSRKYGYHTHVPTQSAIQAALGHLALLPIAADMEVMNYLLANKGDERKFANILVAYCSHLTSKGKDADVFQYTGAIKALGLDKLAEQLRISRCDIRIVSNTDDGTRFGNPIAGEFVIKFSPCTNAPIIRDLVRKYGFAFEKSLLKGIGTGNRYKVDQANLDLLLWAIAGSSWGGVGRVYNNGTILTLPQQSALPVPAGVLAYRTRYQRPAPQPTTPPSASAIGLSITRKNGRNGAFYTVSLPPFWNLGFWKPNKADQKPFWTAFKDDFKRSGRAAWNPTYKNWVVNSRNEQGMFQAIERHLGYTRQQLGY